MDVAGDEWRGRVGQSWASEIARTDRSFAGLTPVLIAALVAALPARTGAPWHILDIGCGAGETAIALADARADAVVTGLDLSPDLVAAARVRAGARAQLSFVEGDAARWVGGQRFDAALSRHGVMFFDDPVAAFAHLRTRLHPGAPLVFTCFRRRSENIWASIALSLLDAPPPGNPRAPGPFAFAEIDDVGAILAAAGWSGASATAVDYRYVAGSGPDPVADAVDFFSRIGPAARLAATLGDAARNVFRRDLAARLAAHVTDGVVAFPAAAWLWRATA
jgi:SAM-dependent methyltransferase